MDADEYQVVASSTFQFEEGSAESKAISIMGLAGEVGELATEYKKQIRDGSSHKLFKEKITEELGDIAWYLASLATQEGILLSEVLAASKKKITERWKDLGIEGQLGFERQFFDDSREEKEQFPREFVVEFVEEVAGKDGKSYVAVSVNGEKFGSQLRDNSYDDDYYRFHDIFHFSYVVKLGWSPVVRGLLKRKRRTDDIVNEIEDGGRAIVIDEAISILVFEYASDHHYLENATGVDYHLLRQVKNLTRNLEVRLCTPKQWEDAILLGFKLWREMKEHGQGRIICDMNEGTMVFEPI